MVTNFREFLARTELHPTTTLPLIHSTQGYFLQSIRESNAIDPRICDVFDEPLTYFFVGRPAYKPLGGDGEAESWELPCCFVFDYAAVGTPARVFPFDSGAFAKSRMPNYIQMMPLDNFQVAGTAEAPGRIIGAYFENARAYFDGRPKDEERFDREYSLNAFDAEIKAIHRLALERHNPNVDDRRLTIELQSRDRTMLGVTKPIAVIAPAPYFNSADFLQKVEVEWGAVPLPYPISSLSVANYYSAIYERIEILFTRMGIF